MSKDLDSYLCARCKRTGYIGDGGHGCYPSANLVQPASASPDILSTVHLPLTSFLELHDKGKLVLKVNCPDGSIEYGEEGTKEEAARLFWEYLGNFIAERASALSVQQAERIRSEQRERDALICEAEEVEVAISAREDAAYNLAIEHCAAAIREQAAGRTQGG